MFELPKIYPITDRRLSGLSHAEQVRRLIAGGARLIQLREKHLSPRDFYAEALDAMAAARGTGCRVIINDRVDLAAAVNADGVHLGQDDLPPAEARKILGAEAIIGFSTHSVEQARAAAELPVDYIAAGPVFSTATKTDHEPVIGTVGLKAVRGAIGRFPLVAIGGLTGETLGEVLRAGADSAAIIGFLVREADEITSRMRTLTTAQ